MKRLVLSPFMVLLAACSIDAPTSLPLGTDVLAAKSSSAGTTPKLSFFKGNASVGWSSAAGSAPADPTNDAAIQIVTNTKIPSAAGAYTWGTDEDAVGIVGRMLGAIDHLGFDSRGYLQPGSPRISLTTVGDDGNHTYFLAAWHCNPGASPNVWVTSNFRSASCQVFRDGEPAGYAGLGAAAVVADANHERVTDWFVIQDEGPAIVYIDRLTVQDWMWTRGGGAGIRSCLDVNPPCI
jgi:hypothetical protein